MKHRYIIFLFILIPLTSLAVNEVKTSSIDWAKGLIIAYSTSNVKFNNGVPIDPEGNSAISLTKGRINAYKNAKNKAYNEIATQLKKLRVDSDNTLIDILEKNDITQKRLSELLQKKVRLKEYPIGFNGSGCKASIKIGNIISVLPYKFPSHDFPTRIDNQIQTEYSSVIIDTRGLKIKPMIFPVIYNEDGLEVYSRYFIDIIYAVKTGMVTYVYSENEAEKNIKSGQHPYYTVALKNMNGCPVLANSEIKKIFSSKKTIETLKKCNVIFIVDNGTNK